MKKPNKYPYPRRHVPRFILRSLTALAFSALSRLEIIGRENFPASGPVLVVANHFQFADPALVLRVVPRQIEFLSGFQMPNAPKIVHWIPNAWGVYHVHRDGSSREAIRAGTAVLKQGGVLGIFPEGGAWASVLRPARPGTAFLATRVPTPIVPIGITGMTELFPALKKRRRVHITVRIGNPFGPFVSEAKKRVDRSELAAIGEEIMRHLAAVLPPYQRGCFSDDPELRAHAQSVAEYPW